MAYLALLEDVVGADLALLEDVVGSDLALLDDAVGAVGCVRRRERVFRQRVFCPILSTLRFLATWHVSDRVMRYSMSFPALAKLFNAWQQSLLSYHAQQSVVSVVCCVSYISLNLYKEGLPMQHFQTS